MIAINLDVLLKDRKTSISDLSAQSGIPEKNLRILASGEIQALRISTLDTLCECLRCKPGDLLDYVYQE